MSPKCSIFLSKGMVPGLIKIGILGLVMVSNSAMDYTLRRNCTLTAKVCISYTPQWTADTPRIFLADTSTVQWSDCY